MSTAKSPSPLILLLDDEPSIQEILQDFFVLLGYRFVAFSTSATALDYITETHPDLIITDLQLTESDGLEFAAQAKTIRKTLPILLLTGVSVSPKTNLTAHGIDAILSKTDSLSELRQKVDQLLKRKRPFWHEGGRDGTGR